MHGIEVSAPIGSGSTIDGKHIASVPFLPEDCSCRLVWTFKKTG